MPVPTVGHVLFKVDWQIEGDKQNRRFATQSEAVDTLLSEALKRPPIGEIKQRALAVYPKSDLKERNEMLRVHEALACGKDS